MNFQNKIVMNDVAMFVGAALQHPMPPCNGEGVISTIHVDQYKTKFNDIRIYCRLAHPDLVKSLWSTLSKEGEPTVEFRQSCLENDARHYRRCYLSMFCLLSDEDLVASLKAPANYSELLCKTPEELDLILNHEISMSVLYPQHLKHYYDKWRVSDQDSLRRLLHKLSGFGEVKK